MKTLPGSTARLGALLFLATCASVPQRAIGAEEPASPPRRLERLPNGLRLGYTELGDRHAPTVIFLHGYTNSGRGYLPLGRLLAENFHVLLVDLRGHGASDKPECCYTRVDFAYDIKLLMDRLHIETADIAGHSLGSFVAQTFAEYWPQRTRRLVLIASTAGRHSADTPGAPPPPPLLGAYDAPIRVLKDPIDPDSPFMQAWWTVPSVDTESQRQMRRESAAIPADVWRAILDQGQSSLDFRATMDRISAPTLLLFGGQDALFSPADRDALIGALPGAKVVLFPELGHSLPEQDPPAVARAMSEFLQSATVSPNPTNSMRSNSP